VSVMTNDMNKVPSGYALARVYSIVLRLCNASPATDLRRLVRGCPSCRWIFNAYSTSS